MTNGKWYKEPPAANILYLMRQTYRSVIFPYGKLFLANVVGTDVAKKPHLLRWRKPEVLINQGIRRSIYLASDLLIKLRMNTSEEKGLSNKDRMVIREILQYLVEHPDAKDTLEGIVRWWLPKDRVEAGEEVQKALDLLVSKGWMTQREILPSPKLYGLNQGRVEEVKVFLQEVESKDGGENV